MLKIKIYPSIHIEEFKLYQNDIYYYDLYYKPVFCNQLNEQTTINLSAGCYFFDTQTGFLYVRMIDNSDPNYSELLRFDIEYTVSKEFILSYPKLTSSFELKELINKAIEGSANTTIINERGNILEKYIFDNKRLEIYQDERCVYKGIIVDKKVNKNTIFFNLKDNLIKLREKKEGKIIYGKQIKMPITAIDTQPDTIVGTGKISTIKNSDVITGIGTIFLNELTQDDTLIINGETYNINRIISDTELTIDSEFNKTIKNIDLIYQQDRVTNKFNRTFKIADNDLWDINRQLVNSPQTNEIELDSVEDIRIGDKIEIGNEIHTVKKIYNNILKLTTAIVGNYPAGTPITRKAIIELILRGIKVKEDNFNLVNRNLVLSNNAEIDITPEKKNSNAVFTNNSRTVTFSNKHKLKVKNFIRSNDVYHKNYYYIVNIVDDFTIELSTNYSGNNYNGTYFYKDVNFIENDEELLITTYGKPNIKYPQDVIKDILPDCSDNSTVGNNYFISYRAEDKKIRDIVNDINKSSFSILNIDENFNLFFSDINFDITQDHSIINIDDIIDYSIEYENNIYNKVICRYAYNFSKTYQSEYTNNFIDIKQVKDSDIYLENEKDTSEIAQRLLRLYDRQNKTIRFITKINNLTINKKIYVNFNDTKGFFLINKVEQSSNFYTIEASNFSFMLDKALRIADNNIENKTLFNTIVEDYKTEEAIIV